MATKFCTSCGTSLAPATRFCAQCGAQVSEANAEPAAVTSASPTLEQGTGKVVEPDSSQLSQQGATASEQANSDKNNLMGWAAAAGVVFLVGWGLVDYIGKRSSREANPVSAPPVATTATPTAPSVAAINVSPAPETKNFLLGKCVVDEVGEKNNACSSDRTVQTIFWYFQTDSASLFIYSPKPRGFEDPRGLWQERKRYDRKIFYTVSADGKEIVTKVQVPGAGNDCYLFQKYKNKGERYFAEYPSKMEGNCPEDARLANDMENDIYKTNPSKEMFLHGNWIPPW